MGNVYAVQIGKNSRRGAFLPEITRFVETDEASEYKVRAHFAGLYIGFDVKASKVEKVESLKIEPKPSKKIIEEMNYLTDLQLDIPESMMELYSEAIRLQGEFRAADHKLRSAIVEVISGKEWVNHVGYDGVKIQYGFKRADVEAVRLDFDIIKEKTVEIE